MFQLFSFIAAAATLATPVAATEQPGQRLMVAADHRVASALPPLPIGAKLTVLIESENEPLDAINSRALSVLHATHFFYSGDRESTLSAIFRERLQNHGVIAVAWPLSIQDARLGRYRLNQSPTPTLAHFFQED